MFARWEARGEEEWRRRGAQAYVQGYAEGYVKEYAEKYTQEWQVPEVPAESAQVASTESPSRGPSWAPAAAPPTPFSACNVALGEEVAEKIKSLNSSGALQVPIDVGTVVGPLSQLDRDAALDILYSLQEQGLRVDDPTTWVCEAAGAIPQEQQASWLEAEEDDAEEESEMELIDGALLVEKPSKRRRTDGAAESGEGGGPSEEEEGAAEEAEGDPAEGEAGAKDGAAEGGAAEEEDAAKQRVTEETAEEKAAEQPAPMKGKAVGKGFPRFLFPANGYRWPPPRVVPPPTWLAGGQVGTPGVAPAWTSRTVPDYFFQRGQYYDGENRRFPHEQQLRLARLQTAYRLGSVVDEEPANVDVGKDLTMDQICNYKTRLCMKFAVGRCTVGEDCLLAHGVTDLRAPWKPPTDDEIAEAGPADAAEDGVDEAVYEE